MKSPFAPTFPLKKLKIDNTTIFYEDSLDNLLSYFSKSKAKDFINLLHEAQTHPKKAYKEALSWKEHHPNNPLLDNLLTFLHLHNRETKQGEALILESYHQYPNYLFAKINYADQCLRFKKPQQIPQIFPSFDLSQLFPNKTHFHVSEFRGFMIVISRYYSLIGNKTLAREFYQKAYLADPAHPTLILLEKELFSQNYLYKSLLLFLKFFRLCYALFIKAWGKNFKTSFP